MSSKTPLMNSFNGILIETLGKFCSSFSIYFTIILYSEINKFWYDFEYDFVSIVLLTLKTIKQISILFGNIRKIFNFIS